MKRKPRRGKSLDFIIGKKFGRLLVEELIWVFNSKGKRHRKAKCRCDCGKINLKGISELERGHARSCGCLRKENNFKRDFIDLTGQKFGDLTVLEYVGPHRKGGSTWKCKCFCGKETVARARRLKDGTTKSCGCYQKCSGERHWNWDSSISKEERKNRKRGKIKDLQYEKWRKNVFSRDDYKCVITGISKKIEAHHLNAWNAFPEERYSLDNGVTLTREIHMLFHKIYGLGNNTKEQFDEFKNSNPSQELARSILQCKSCEA